MDGQGDDEIARKRIRLPGRPRGSPVQYHYLCYTSPYIVRAILAVALAPLAARRPVTLETTAEHEVVVASSAVTEAVVANPVAAVLVGLVASPAVVVGSAMPAAVVVELVANPAAAEVEMVVNTGRTEASFGAVLPPAVKLLGAVALHRRLRRPCLISISRSRGRFPLTARLIGVIG